MNFHDNSYHACNEDIMFIFLSNVVEYLILSSFHSTYYYLHQSRNHYRSNNLYTILIKVNIFYFLGISFIDNIVFYFFFELIFAVVSILSTILSEFIVVSRFVACRIHSKFERADRPAYP